MAHGSSSGDGREDEPRAEGLEGVVLALRSAVRDRLARHLVPSAVFLADKLVSMSGGAEHDVYMLADAHFRSGAERRAEQLLRKHGLLVTVIGGSLVSSLRCQYLGARCLSGANDWDSCLTALECAMGGDDGGDAAAADPRQRGLEALRLPDRAPFTALAGAAEAEERDRRRTLACMCLLRGAALEKKDRRRVAAQWYARALQLDVLCTEAFDALVGHALLKAEEQRFLWSQLLLPQFGADEQWLAALYRSQLLLYEPMEPVVLVQAEPMEGVGDDADDDAAAAAAAAAAAEGALLHDWGLNENLDVQMMRAERCFQSHDVAGTHRLTESVLALDPHMKRGLETHICALVELGRKADLFKLAHELVADCPESPHSWFAVGCYYKLTRKNSSDVRKFFDKATRKDPGFAPGWIGFGNAFAEQDESEQALAAYRQAERLYVGCHVPTLYIGMEYLRVGLLDLAEQHLRMCVGVRGEEERAHSSACLSFV